MPGIYRTATVRDRRSKTIAPGHCPRRTKLVNVKRFAFAAAPLTVALLTAATAHAALSIMPLKDVRAGMHGIGKTVFNGDKIEDFQVEILGVLENTGPRESLILGRLSGRSTLPPGRAFGVVNSSRYGVRRSASRRRSRSTSSASAQTIQ